MVCFAAGFAACLATFLMAFFGGGTDFFFEATDFLAVAAFGAVAFTLGLAFTATFGFTDLVIFVADFEDFFGADFLVFFFAAFAMLKLSLYNVFSAVLSYIPIGFSTRIIAVSRKSIPFLTILLLTACARLSTLTPDMLSRAEARWNSSKPASYRLVIEMSGDRVEKEDFEVAVHAGQITRLRRNGLEVTPTTGQEYSMEGLFRTLREELDLAQKPTLLGAPEGYSVYQMAQFDDQTGRLIEYQRTVGGTTNTIHIKVQRFELQPN